MRRTLSCAALFVIFAPTVPHAVAQQLHFEPAEAPELVGEIALPAPASEGMPPESWLAQAGDLQVRNVSKATLLPVIPQAHLATGEAVIVAPGGGFLGLAIENEGYEVAAALAERGIAAFVLKYRVLPTPADFETFVREMVAGRTGGKSSFRPPDNTPEESLIDARAALAYVRDHAASWGVDSGRVGMMGFSAGAFLTLSAATELPPDERPAFIAPIYPRMAAVSVPAGAPPMFVGIAADDHLFGNGEFGLISAWHAAGRPVEFHLYQGGQHAYGLGRAGTTTAGWLDDYVRWVRYNYPLPSAAR